MTLVMECGNMLVRSTRDIRFKTKGEEKCIEFTLLDFDQNSDQNKWRCTQQEGGWTLWKIPEEKKAPLVTTMKFTDILKEFVEHNTAFTCTARKRKQP
jgi:hypothetical protein